MKKYLLSLLIVFASALGISSNAGALSYPYTAFPLHDYNYLTGPLSGGFGSAQYGTNFTVGFLSEQDGEINYLKNPQGKFIPYRWNSTSQTCEERAAQNIFSHSTSSVNVFSSQVLGNTDFYYYFDLPNSSDYDSFISSINGNRLWECYHKPWYEYDSIYSTSYSDLSSTPYIDASVDLADQFISSNEGLYSLAGLNINLPIDTENIDLPAGTDLEWNFQLFTYDVFSSGFTNIDDNAIATLGITYFKDSESFTGTYSEYARTSNNPNKVIDSITCSIVPNQQILVVHDDLTVNTAYAYNITCNYHLDYEASYIFPYLILRTSSNSNKLFTFDIRDGLMFGSSSLVTNNNEAPSGKSANPEPTGTKIEDAPGWSDLYDDNTGDYNYDLTHLFNFNVINPFGSIYDLFTSHQNCVDISTLASMLNSPETVYCSWWPNSVVNVVTPVMALSSTMLLFGFFVSWLRSDAGDASIDNGGTSIKVKGSKK